METIFRERQQWRGVFPSPKSLPKAPRPVALPVSSRKLHKAPQLPTPLAAATATTDPPVANANFRNGVSGKVLKKY